MKNYVSIQMSTVLYAGNRPLRLLEMLLVEVLWSLGLDLSQPGCATVDGMGLSNWLSFLQLVSFLAICLKFLSNMLSKQAPIGFVVFTLGKHFSHRLWNQKPHPPTPCGSFKILPVHLKRRTQPQLAMASSCWRLRCRKWVGQGKAFEKLKNVEGQTKTLPTTKKTSFTLLTCPVVNQKPWIAPRTLCWG